MEHAKARGAHIYAELCGYGQSAEAYHITAAREDGYGALMAMKRAATTKINYINAHATSTKIGDAAEACAIQQFTDNAFVSSTKGAIGHLLGAAGAVEAIYTVLAVANNTIPPNINIGKADVSINLSQTAHKAEVNAALTNSFGFGGVNVSVCFKKV